jgi:high-affinity K+ transport system ATPase subunit B
MIENLLIYGLGLVTLPFIALVAIVLGEVEHRIRKRLRK